MPLSDDPRPAPWFVLPTPAGESILTEFNAGQVTSDGGLLWLARADEQTDGILGIACRDPLALDDPVFLDAIPSIGPI